MISQKGSTVYKIKYIGLVLLCIIGFTIPTMLIAEPSKSPVPAEPKNEEQFWNLKNVDIRTLISQVSKETGKNFVVDPRVKGEVTVISNHALSPDEFYQVFLEQVLKRLHQQ